MGLAVCVSGRSSLSRSAVGTTIQVSRPRIGGPASGCGGGPPGGLDQTGWVSHLSSFVRDRIASLRSRHSDGPGAARSCRGDDNNDPYPCARPRRPRRPQSIRPLVTGGRWIGCRALRRNRGRPGGRVRAPIASGTKGCGALEAGGVPRSQRPAGGERPDAGLSCLGQTDSAPCVDRSQAVTSVVGL